MNPLFLFAFGLALLGTLLGYLFGIARALSVGAVLVLLAGALSLASGGDVALWFLMILAYALPTLAIPAVAGVLSGHFFRAKKFLAGALLLAPIPLLLGVQEFSSVNETKESQLAAKFVEQDPRIQQFAAGPITVRPTVPTRFSDSSRARYEFDFPGKSGYHIIVEVSRRAGRSDFRLSCVTTLSIGQREGNGDPCSKGAIALPSP